MLQNCTILRTRVRVLEFYSRVELFLYNTGVPKPSTAEPLCILPHTSQVLCRRERPFAPKQYTRLQIDATMITCTAMAIAGVAAHCRARAIAIIGMQARGRKRASVEVTKKRVSD